MRSFEHWLKSRGVLPPSNPYFPTSELDQSSFDLETLTSDLQMFDNLKTRNQLLESAINRISELEATITQLKMGKNGKLGHCQLNPKVESSS